jgi:hypothetical protein
MLTIVILAALVGFLAYRSAKMPGMALVALYCMLSVEQWAQANSEFFVNQSYVVNLLFAAVVGFAFMIKVVKQGLGSEPYPLAAILVITLFAYALFSTIWTFEDVETNLIWGKWAPYIFLQVVIAPFLIADPKDLTKVFAYQMFLGGLVVALIIFGAEYEGRKVVLSGGQVVGGNPLAIAELGGVTTICAVMMTRLFKGDIILKVLISGLCLIAIIKSGSRGQLIALVLALVVAYPFTYSIKNPKVFAGSALLIVIFGFVVFAGLDEFWGGTSGRFSGTAMSEDYVQRIDQSARVLAAWIRDPAAILFGLGNSASYDWSVIHSYPHFVPLEILAEEGVIGAMIYLWILILTMRESLYVLRRKNQSREDSAAFAILVGIIVYMFLISLKQGSLIGTATFFMSVMIFSKAVAVTRAADRKSRASAAEKPLISSNGHDWNHAHRSPT